MNSYPYTQADQTPEIDALANQEGAAADEPPQLMYQLNPKHDQRVACSILYKKGDLFYVAFWRSTRHGQEYCRDTVPASRLSFLHEPTIRQINHMNEMEFDLFRSIDQERERQHRDAQRFQSYPAEA